MSSHPKKSENKMGSCPSMSVLLTKSICKNIPDQKMTCNFVVLEDNATPAAWRDAVRAEINTGGERLLFIGRGRPTALSEKYDGVVVLDQINVSGQNPLVGPNDEKFGTRFPDISGLYNPEINTKIITAAKSAGLNLQPGIILIPASPIGLTTLEQDIICKNGIAAATRDVFAGAITAKHAGYPCAGLVLFSAISGVVLEKIVASPG